MVAFLLLFRSLWHILKILFRQEEQRAIMLALLFILLIGTVFYHNVEGMTYLDALYFSVMTLATVGYGGFSAPDSFRKTVYDYLCADWCRNHHGRDREFQSGFG